MSTTEAPQVPVCPGCSRTLIVRGEYTLCPTEDAVQKSETEPSSATFVREEVIDLDGTKILNPFGVSARVTTLFDRAHSSRFTAQKKEWYGK